MNHTKLCILFIILIQSALFSNSNEHSLEFDKLSIKAMYHYFNAEYDLAYEYNVKSLEYDPNNPFAHFYIGDYYAIKGEFKKALNHFNIAIENHTHKIFQKAYW